MNKGLIPGNKDVIPGLTRDPSTHAGTLPWIAGQARNDIC